ncbi:hypothetical protein [Sphingomonas sp. Leaf205]|uniref:hypothetical protein n=1 Tax=Sphingomonas sp. Leaf205 TaxID=2876551 RepID=UPI001E36D16D|nr:hypothetical protein [Sphingomonas sp. Leaf205]
MITPFEIRLPTSRAGFASDQTICSFSAGWLNIRTGRDGWRNDSIVEVPSQLFDPEHRVDDQVAYRIEDNGTIVRACREPEIGDVVLLLESPHRDEFDGCGGRAIGPLRNERVRAAVERYLPDILKGAEERLGRSLAGRGVNLVNAVQYQTSLQSLMIDYDAKLQSGVRTPVFRAVFDNGGSQDMLARLDRYEPSVVLSAPTSAVRKQVEREIEAHARCWPWLRVDRHPSSWMKRAPRLTNNLSPPTILLQDRPAPRSKLE